MIWLQLSLGLSIVGYVGAAGYYWFWCEYKLAMIFLLYAVTNAIFVTIAGVK